MTKSDQSLADELRRQASHPPAGDLRIAAFAHATARLLDTPDGFELSRILQLRGLNGSGGVNLLLRCLQRQLMEIDPDYPLSYLVKKSWEEGWRQVLEDANHRQKFLSDLALRQVQSNISERYKSLKLLSLMTGCHQPRILDLGCSQNHGLKRLAGDFPFSSVSGPGSATVNQLLAAPFNIGQSLGTDIIAQDADSAAWARACSFYPSELLNRQALQVYDQLEDSRPDMVEFKQVDAAAQYSLNRRFDIVFVSTFLYQLRPAQINKVRELAKAAVGGDGIIVYQDFLELSKGELYFPDNWFGRSFAYRTVVEIPAQDQLLEVFKWKDGRCREFEPGRDYGRLAKIR